MDFDEKLRQASDEVQDNLQQRKAAQQQADQDARHQQADANQRREAALAEASNIAHNVMRKYIEPVTKSLQEKMRGSFREGKSPQHERWMSSSLQYGDEHLTLKAEYDETAVRFMIDAQCEGKGSVYHRMLAFDVPEFDEARMKEWIDENAIEAFKAFMQHSVAVQNRVPPLKVNGREV